MTSLGLLNGSSLKFSLLLASCSLIHYHTVVRKVKCRVRSKASYQNNGRGRSFCGSGKGVSEVAAVAVRAVTAGAHHAAELGLVPRVSDHRP